MLTDPLLLALVAATFLLAGAVKGVIGMGLPTVSLAILTATVGLHAAMALMVVPSFVTNLWQAMVGGHGRAILARLGAFVWETTETFTENGFVSVDKNDGTDAHYGLGFEYDIGTPDKWILRGDVARTEVDDDGNGTNMANLTFAWKF